MVFVVCMAVAVPLTVRFPVIVVLPPTVRLPDKSVEAALTSKRGFVIVKRFSFNSS